MSTNNQKTKPLTFSKNKKMRGKKSPDYENKEADECWYYSARVKDHFFNPRNFLKDGPKEGEFDAEGEVGNFKCGDIMHMWVKIDEKTDKIKKVGWKTFGSLIRGEQLLMSDYRTIAVENALPQMKIINGNGSFEKIEEVIEKDYNGNILTFQLATSNYYNLSVTPNHPFPYISRDEISNPIRKNGRWSEVKDELLQKGKIKLSPASEIKEGDFLIFKIDNEIKDNKDLNEDICCLLGYYVSDGNIKSVNRVVYHFNVTEEPFIEEVENIAKKLKWEYKIFKRNNQNVLCIQIYNKELVNLLSKHGGLPSQKRFSEELMKLPPKKQMIIIDSYLNGDGWSTLQKENWNEQYFISTSEENLAYQIQAMLARNEIFAPIHKRQPRFFKIRDKEYSNSGEINLIFKKNKQHSWVKYHKKYKCFLIPIKKIILYEYKGYIYDIALSSEPHTYKIKGITVHNCAPAIASTSMFSEMISENGGMKIADALKITPNDIIKKLGGVPSRKIHCSVMAHQAFRKAVENYKNFKD